MTTYNATVKNGIASIEIPSDDIIAGTHNITAQDQTNNQYQQSTTTSQLTLAKADVTITPIQNNINVGDQVHITARITNSRSQTPINEGQCTLFISSKAIQDENGEKVSPSVVNGVLDFIAPVNYVLEDWKTTPPKITIKYSGTDNFKTKNFTSSVDVFLNIQ